MDKQKQLRVLVGEMTGILRDIIQRTVAGRPDMVLINHEAPDDLGEAVVRYAADVAIVAGEREGRAVSHEHLLFEHANLKLLVVTGDGRRADLVELRARRFDQLTPRSLVTAIRSSRAPRRTPHPNPPPKHS